MTDLRDPRLLGEYLLNKQALSPTVSLSRTMDILKFTTPIIPNYDANPSCIEKYGRPQDLPPTPF